MLLHDSTTRIMGSTKWMPPAMAASAPAMAMAPAPAGAWYRWRIEKVLLMALGFMAMTGYDKKWCLENRGTFGTCQSVYPKKSSQCNNWFSTIGRRGKMQGRNCLSPGGSCWCSVSMNLALTTCHYLQRFGPAHLCRQGHSQQNCRCFLGFSPRHCLATVTRKPYRLNMGWTLWTSFWYSA